jgi:Ca2+-binding RTX toxin-like protein
VATPAHAVRHGREASLRQRASRGPDSVVGGDGDDIVSDGGLNGATSALSGGAGEDEIHALDRSDESGGVDEVVLVPTADFIPCGPGGDRLVADRADPRPADCEVVTVALSNHFSTRGSAGSDVIEGLAGVDRISALAGNDRVSGLTGKDRIDGGPGRDKLYGDRGNDSIRARDGERDRIKCGSGRDTVVADALDRVPSDCERIKLPA